MSAAGLFFVGTDTDVGKTHVLTAVARLLRTQGHAVRVCKPVATGAVETARGWWSEDTLRLAEAAGQVDELGEVTPWTFREPLAPAVAARREGVALDLGRLAAAVERCRRPNAALLVEGVGGLLCPLTETETVADLAARLALPLVVVTRRSLGTLNHTLLTLEVARHRGLGVAGVVVSTTTPVLTPADVTNPEELRRRLTVALLAVLPHHSERPTSGLPGLADVDWWQLCRAGGATGA